MAQFNKSEIKRLIDKLEEAWPAPESALTHENPLQLLVATILSAQCTDKRVNEVTKTLFKKYKTVSDFARADLKTLEEEIHSTGFFRQKTLTITAGAQKILDDFGGDVPKTMEELVSLPGVGRKTASVVLSAAFGIPAIAVDTHVFRVTNRLGLASAKTADKLEAALREILPRQYWIPYSFGIILHGRQTCKAIKPRCGQCMLSELCRWPQKTA
jgi:endonuclease-3